jgi:hypothetical protein
MCGWRSSAQKSEFTPVITVKRIERIVETRRSTSCGSVMSTLCPPSLMNISRFTVNAKT